MQKLLKLILPILFFNALCADEIGKYDTGDYCFRTAGSKSCRRMQDDDSALKSGSSGPYPVEIFEYPSWQNRLMDFEKVRESFPILKSTIHDYPFVYFDSAATAQMPQEVLDAMIDYYQHYKANVGRGMYDFAEKSTKLFEQARSKVAQFIGAGRHEIVFVPGTTAGINLIVDIWAEKQISEGDEIIISEAEHNANLIPWQQLARRKGATLRVIPVNQDGVMDLEILSSVISDKTKIVAVTHQSNILGAPHDIALIAQVAHSVGAKLVVDAAQSVAHHKIDVQELDCDFLVFSAHKLYGPTGVGVLFIRENLFDTCCLHNFGGGIVYFVTQEHTEFKEIPYSLEPGTPAIASVIGLGVAIDFIQNNIHFEQACEHETKLVRQLAAQLEKIPGITIISPMPKEGKYSNLVTFTSDKFHAYDIAQYLGKYGIAVRAGYHCVQMYYDIHQIDAAVRVSFAVYNTQQEVDYFVECLKKLFE